jgi:putative ABC transport system substrate-binding protein
MLRKNTLFLALFIFLLTIPVRGYPAGAKGTTNVPLKINSNTKSIGISQVVEHPALDTVRLGVMDALKEQGFIEGKNLVVHYENAQGNMVTSTQIATKLLSTPPNVIVGISTLSAQTVFYAAQRSGKRVPIVFAAVSDPVAAKLEAGELLYPITGVTDRPNLEGLLEVIQKILPRLKNLGLIYNPAEANSVATIQRLKQLLIDKKLEDVINLQEVTVNTTSDVAQAMKSLIGKVDALYFSQDNTVVSAIETVVNIAKQKHPKPLPLFCSDPLLVKRGVLAAVGYDYMEIGREAGDIVVRILNGEPAEYIPVHSPEHLKTVINKDLLLKLGLTIPKKLEFSEISFSQP